MGCLRKFLSSCCGVSGHDSPKQTYTRLPDHEKTADPIRFPPAWNAIGCQDSRYPSPQQLARNLAAASPRGRKHGTVVSAGPSRQQAWPTPEIIPKRVAASFPLLPPRPASAPAPKLAPGAGPRPTKQQSRLRHRREHKRESPDHAGRYERRNGKGPNEPYITAYCAPNHTPIRTTGPPLNITRDHSHNSRFVQNNANVVYNLHARTEQLPNPEIQKLKERRARHEQRSLTRAHTRANARQHPYDPTQVRFDPHEQIIGIEQQYYPSPPPSPPPSRTNVYHAPQLSSSLLYPPTPYPRTRPLPTVSSTISDLASAPHPPKLQKQQSPSPSVTTLHPVLLGTSKPRLSWDLTRKIRPLSQGHFDAPATAPYALRSSTILPFPQEWERNWGSIHVSPRRNGEYVTVGDVLQAIYDYYHTPLTREELDDIDASRHGGRKQVDRAYWDRLVAGGGGRGERRRVDALGQMVMFEGVRMSRSWGTWMLELGYPSSRK
ncbi:hypothetical protein V5O48_007592 [Marasmius crinis-equi]|uniref:DUF6699 domain-containing protein n=1 Tax=Marasmius crinis-equi TaxID=585013 RepID=A0ABR3FGH1_9AGAR